MSRPPKFLLLFLLFLAAAAETQAQVNYTTNADGSVYGCSTNADGTIAIDGYTGPPWAVAIPTNLNGAAVTSLGPYAFASLASLTSVTIPGSVTSIGEAAFAFCSGLSNAVISQGVTSFGQGTFYGCGSLTSLAIPGSVTNFGQYAFQYCNNLTNVTIANGVTGIGDNAFYGSSLTSITIPAGVTSIGYGMFYDSPNLASVYFLGNAPAVAGNPGDGPVFYGDNNVTVYYLSGAAGWGGTFAGAPTMAIISPAQFTYTTNAGAITITGYTGSGGAVFIPAQINGLPVTGIGPDAFYTNASLTSVIIPGGVTSIGDSAFNGCAALSNVTLPASVTNIGDGAFDGCASLLNITIPAGVTSLGDLAFNGCASLSNVTLPGSVTNLGDSAFNGCASLLSITLPGSVVSLGDLAFGGCSKLADIAIPAGLSGIGYGAFYDCGSLAGVYCYGNAPAVVGNPADGPVFFGDNSVTVYYVAGSVGWSNTFAGAPTLLWNPVGNSGVLSNQVYQVALQTNTSIIVTGPGGARQTFQPVFKVMNYQGNNPQLTTVPGPDPCQIYVPQWTTPGGATTTSYLQAAPLLAVAASNGVITSSNITWAFPPQNSFNLTAQLAFVDGSGEPCVTFSLTPLQSGFFSVGFAGAPALDPGAVTALWQPFGWQEKRFPAASVLSMEHMCSLTTTLVTAGNSTYGVVADPSIIPFRLPVLANACCGVLLRNEAGLVQPMFFAPVLGGANSWFSAGTVFTSCFRLVVGTNDIYGTYKHLARDLYAVRDFRQNTLCSLNTTLSNMIALALDDTMSGWEAGLRGCNYSTDVPNTVKVVSALHPMSIALITDRQDIFDRRAVPMMEYLLSREKYLFTTDPTETAQGASAKMLGPTGEVFEWSSLYHFSQGRSPIFRGSAFRRLTQPRALNDNVIVTDAKWVDELALYRLTGETSYLDQATSLADNYLAWRINTPQTTWYPYDEFCSDFTPRWVQLMELYEDTGQQRYLDAATAGARSFAGYCAMSPPVPPGNVTLNMTVYQPGSATVPAWRPSQAGLTPEAVNTLMYNPAIFMTHFSAYFLRMGWLTGDTFFRDIARNAVVGRYASYPGYSIEYEYSTNYEPATYAATPPPQSYRYNAIYFNHIWPQIALLMDYLISDAVTRSGGRIAFPSRYAQGYVYLQSKVYGDQPGTFYGDTNVWLYMPEGGVTTDNIQINNISARGNNRFYIALLNQSTNAVTTTVTINVPGLDTNASYGALVYAENQPAGTATVQNGQLQLTVACHGITAAIINGLNPAPSFQNEVLATNSPALTDTSYGTFMDPNIQQINAEILDFGSNLSSVYVWLNADPTVVANATLNYRLSGCAWQQTNKGSFPYDFHIPIPDTNTTFDLYLTGTLAGGGAFTTATNTLRPGGLNKPDPLLAQPGFTSIQLSWSAVSNASAYNVLRSTNGGLTYGMIATNLASLSFTDFQVQPGVSYTYTVAATNAASGGGAPADAVTLASDSIVYDTASPQFSSFSALGPWPASTATAGYYGPYYCTDGTPGADSTNVYAQWSFAAPVTAIYQLYMLWTAGPDRPASVPLAIGFNGGVDTGKTVNEQTGNGVWTLVGLYNFSAAATNYVKIIATGNGSTVANAIKLQMMDGSIIVDNADATGVTIISNWTSSTFVAGYYGSNYLHDGNTGAVGGKKVIFTPNLPASGAYQVFLNWTVGTNRAGNTPVDVLSAAGTNTFSLNQQSNGAWPLLGIFNFNAGAGGSVVVRNDGANGYVIADAVKFTPVTAFLSVPSGLAATRGDGRTVLSWNAAIGASGYNVKSSTTNGAGYVTVARNVAGLSWTNTGLTDGAWYYFVVSGTNSSGESPNSPQVAVQPVALAPVQMTCIMSAGQLQVSWPSNYLGWHLQVQTNTNGIGTNWQAWPGTTNTNSVTISLNTSNPEFFLRLAYP